MPSGVTVLAQAYATVLRRAELWRVLVKPFLIATGTHLTNWDT